MATRAMRLPDVGEGIAEAEVVRWLVEVGDRVRDGDPVVEVMTDKATVELPTPAGPTCSTCASRTLPARPRRATGPARRRCARPAPRR